MILYSVCCRAAVANPGKFIANKDVKLILSKLGENLFSIVSHTTQCIVKYPCLCSLLKEKEAMIGMIEMHCIVMYGIRAALVGLGIGKSTNILVYYTYTYVVCT